MDLASAWATSQVPSYTRQSSLEKGSTAIHAGFRVFDMRRIPDIPANNATKAPADQTDLADDRIRGELVAKDHSSGCFDQLAAASGLSRHAEGHRGQFDLLDSHRHIQKY
jgi:hypothetical protein